jgi:hypothetical protein
MLISKPRSVALTFSSWLRPWDDWRAPTLCHFFPGIDLSATICSSKLLLVPPRFLLMSFVRLCPPVYCFRPVCFLGEESKNLSPRALLTNGEKSALPRRVDDLDPCFESPVDRLPVEIVRVCCNNSTFNGGVYWSISQWSMSGVKLV